jgi:phosphoribosylformylglycinamidine cyclo-ligase
VSEAYRNAGVDIAAADALVERIKSDVTATWGANIVGGFGGFAGGFTIPPGYAEPVLMMTTDGVGTKLDLARRTGILSGIGHDLVAMCVDDLAASGARPLAFTDYLAVGSINADRDAAIVASIAAGCRRAGCALVGGETAEHPGTMEPSAFDLAGAAVGVVERADIMTGELIATGDAIVGVFSPNLRSNGFSLVRSIIGDTDLGAAFPGDDDGRTFAEVLLEPSVIYSPAILQTLSIGAVHGLAHITGGGLIGNLPRILPDTLSGRVEASAWSPPNVFDQLGIAGSLDRAEMYGVFNMGIGFVVITDRPDDVVEHLGASAVDSAVIGEVVTGDGTVDLRL